MGAPYSEDLRLRVLAAVDGGLSKTQVYRTFGVSRSTIDDWLKLRAETGGVEANTHYYRGRRPMLSDTSELRAFMEKHQGSTLAQLSAAWKQEQGQQVSVKTFHKQECRQSVKPYAEGIISGSQARTSGQQGVSQDFGSAMLRQLPADAGCSLPFQTYQFEGSVNQLDMLQVGGVGQTLT